MFYNYKLTWNDNHYVYAGSTNDPKRRFQEHRKLCRGKKPPNRMLANVWKKYGEPTMTIMGQFETIEEMVENEQFLIDQIFGESVCLNLNPIAGVPPVIKGKIVSKETRQKLSIAGRGRVFTEEHKAKIALSHKGKLRSEEHCNALSLAKSTPVIAFNKSTSETIRFDSVKATSTFFGFSVVSINHRIVRGTFTKCGWSFRRTR